MAVPASSHGHLVDLGTLSAASLAAGAATLYTPPTGAFVALNCSSDGYVAINGLAVDFTLASLISQVPGGTVKSLGEWNVAATAWYKFEDSFSKPPLPLADGSALRAVWLTDTNAIPVIAAAVAWQANHVYAANVVILGPDNHLWSSTAGTSAGTIPDFASHHAGSVVDNGVTWTDEGAIPTTGAVHLHALVIT